MRTEYEKTRTSLITSGRINRWMVIGPFITSEKEREFIPVDAADPNKTYKQNMRELKWKSWYTDGESLDKYQFEKFIGNEDFNLYYLCNHLYLRSQTEVCFTFDTNCKCCWYVNGRKEYEFDNNIGEEKSFHCVLKRGWNFVMVKCLPQSTVEFEASFEAAITDSNGEEIDLLLVKNGFLLPDDTETHMFGKNPSDMDQAIRTADTDDYQRSKPDIVLYVPKEGDKYNDGDNEHFLVTVSPKSGDLVAIWTQGLQESYGDNHIMLKRSSDGGMKWSEPQYVAGTTLGGNETQASWAVPVFAKTGRLYCLYTKSNAGTPSGISGVMGTMQSDDEGRSWRHGPDIVIPAARKKYDDPDSPTDGVFIAWQKPIRDRQGMQLLGYTVWKNERGRCYFMRFDNIDESPDAENLKITWLPDDNKPLEMPIYLARRECSEPSPVLLPDGRLFTTMRTLTGHIWYSVSEDDGHTWRDPQELRYKDAGEKIKHPLSCCPIYSLKNGRYILLHCINNFFAERHYRGEELPVGMNMFTHRRPLFISVGNFMPEAYQPLWFEKPRQILDNEGVIVGPKATNEIGTYPSLTESNGKRILWYPDRKYYLLGKYITDEMLGI